MQTDAELGTEPWYQTTSRTTESGHSLCRLDRLPYYRRRCCYYSVWLFCPYCLNRLLCLYCSRSVPLPDLFYCWICWICYDAQLFRPTCSVLVSANCYSNQSILLLPTSCSTAATTAITIPTVPFYCSDCSTATILTNCYRLTATDWLLPTVCRYRDFCY